MVVRNLFVLLPKISWLDSTVDEKFHALPKNLGLFIYGYSQNWHLVTHLNNH